MSRRILASLALILLPLIVTIATAQPGRGGAGITGSVLADESGEGLPGATIAIWNAADSTLVTGTVTTLEGTFSIDGLPAGAYYVKISSLGYLMQTRGGITLERGRHDLGAVRMIEDESIEDDGITVSGTRADVEFRSDRTVYNVENQPVTAGGNAIDVLKNVPQVEVDIDDNVSMRGSTAVAVHVNGRPVPISGDALTAFLKSLSADMVQSIEIIPNPSAKYDPEGMAGIINIVLKEKKGESGISGTLSVSAGTGPEASANGSLNGRTSKLNVFGSYSFRYDERDSEADLFRENRLLTPNTLLYEETDGGHISRSHFVNTTIDYTMSPTSTLTLSGFVNPRGGRADNRILYAFGTEGSSLFDSTARTTPQSWDGFSYDASIGYRWVKEPQTHELAIDARYYGDDDDHVGSFTERLAGEPGIDSIVQLQSTLNRTGHRLGTISLDYVRPIGANGRLETGYKGELSRIDNGVYSETFDPTVGDFRPDTALNNDFIYDDQVHALYLIYNHTFGKFDAQAGVRAEQALIDFDLVTTGEVFENDYFSLFPSAALSYAFGDATRLRASYSRRIERPGVWHLNPFPQYEDRLNLRHGNPYLKPEYIDAFELGLSHYTGWGSLSLSPYYRHSTNLIERWLTVDSNGVSTVSWENFATTDSYGAEAVASFRLKDRLRGFVNGSFYQFDLDGSNIESDLANNAFGWSASANVTFTATPWLDLQSNYFYRAPINISRGTIDAFHSADAAAKLTFLQKRASLSLRVSDLFNTMKFSLVRDDPDAYLVEATHRWGSRRASLTFAYTFGQQNQQQQRRRPQGGGEGGGGGTPAGVGF